MTEFNIIERYFTPHYEAHFHKNIILGIGDDCALIEPTPNTYLAISTDMLIEKQHFFSNIDPETLGYKALAVNLSDLAAMGATPRAFTISIALPKADEKWLSSFSKGLFSLANQFDCALIGGDTTKGPLIIISITIWGEAQKSSQLRRDNAKIGDDIWISGHLGDARLCLGLLRFEQHLNSDITPLEEKKLLNALNLPHPRVKLGQALINTANAAIDISDGLAGDLNHILKKSGVSASIDIDKIPVSSILMRQTEEIKYQCALGGGDDYELCFTASPKKREQIKLIEAETKIPLTRIGTIQKNADDHHSKINYFHLNQPYSFTHLSFDHFNEK